MRFILRLSFLFLILISCKKNSIKPIDVSNIKVDFIIDRFEVDFYNTKPNTLQETKSKYPLFFPSSMSDSIWLAKINDKDELKLFNETQKVYGTIDELSEQLSNLFKHIKYYFKDFKSPDVTTLISDIDYENRAIYSNNMLLISLDCYLGSNHPFYQDYPKYIKQNNNSDNIPVDVANVIIEKFFANKSSRVFIDKIIEKGKRKYILKKILPQLEESLILGYTRDKLDWAIANEEQIWRYFIENETLFSTDQKLDKRFIDVAPFSKFYSESDSKSPGSIGVWIGYKIVAAYMQNNDVSLQSLIEKNAESIFKASNYKPKK